MKHLRPQLKVYLTISNRLTKHFLGSAPSQRRVRVVSQLVVRLYHLSNLTLFRHKVGLIFGSLIALLSLANPSGVSSNLFRAANDSQRGKCLADKPIIMPY